MDAPVLRVGPGDHGLYTAGTEGPVTLYYQSLSDRDLGDQPDPERVWDDDEGCWLLAPARAVIADPGGFRDNLAKVLGRLQPGSRSVAWITDPNASATKLRERLVGEAANLRLLSILKSSSHDASTYQLTTPTTLPFGDVRLVAPQQSTVALDTTSWELRITQGRAPFFLHGAVNVRDIGAGTLHIPLVGNDLGTLRYEAGIAADELYAVFLPTSAFAARGPELRYSYGPNPHVKHRRELRYPFFDGAAITARGQGPELFLSPRLDPLNPRDARRTNFCLDIDRFPSGPPTSEFFLTPAGNPVTLTPRATPDAPGGMALGARGDGGADGDFSAYLVPGGQYRIGQPGDDRGIVRVMCGLWGTEFLLAAEGDLLEFSAGGPAAAEGYSPGGDPDVETGLSGPADTAYARLLPNPDAEASPFTGLIRQSYCVLAPESVYYGSSTDASFPPAIGCRMADLSNPSETAAFPMVPYGAVYGRGADGSVIDGDLASTTLASYETDVLAAARRRAMPGNRTVGPVFFDLADNKPLRGGTVHTGRGLVVELNTGPEEATPAGTWRRLALARSPVHDEQVVAFDASDVQQPGADHPEVVSPHLSNALLGGAPFLVIGALAAQPLAGGRTPLGGFADELTLGEFTFKLDVGGDAAQSPGGDQPEGGAIIIFKYSTDASVLELFNQADKWTAAETFVGDDDQVEALQGRIRANFEAAGLFSDGQQAGTDRDLFADFRRKMSSADWTGMVVLDCPLDYGALPMDIQVLLGGVKAGVLRAHHLGVTSNQLPAQLPADHPPKHLIDQSSLFALIHYDEELDKPDRYPDFQLLRLNALYANSELAHFDSRIAVAIQQLFGDQVALQAAEDAPNDKPEWGCVVIDGTYQQRGTAGVVVFRTDQPRTFTFTGQHVRALDRVVADSIALEPRSRDTDSSRTTIDAAISLAGQLGFASDITDGHHIDLFSYDVPSGGHRGLGFASYDLDMTTVIPENGTPYACPITHNVGAMSLDATDAEVRDGSLIATYPLKLTGLRYAESGITPASIGGKRVHIAGYDAGATAPTYALELRMIMGTAGALAGDKTPLEGSLLVGWKAGGDERSDSFTVLFEPPKAMGEGDSLTLEGVIGTALGAMTLARQERGDDCPPGTQFVLEIDDVVFDILGLPFQASSPERSLALFGDPTSLGTGETRLAWFIGVDGQQADTVKLTSGFIFTPLFGLTSGLKVKTDLTSTMPLRPALTELTEIAGFDLAQVINDICKGAGGGSKLTYDPSAGLLFFLNLNLTMLGIKVQALFADPTFYGGRIAFSAPPDKGKKAGALAPVLKVLAGFSVEVDYRKVSDGLGVWSFDLAFTRRKKEDDKQEDDKQAVIKLGPAEIVLPSVGVSIWTNGDWEVAVGWPFSSTSTFVNGDPLKIFIGTGPWQFEFQAGFYAANLHPQDVPEVFGGCPFGLIKKGGAGLAGGLGREFSKGPLSGQLELYVSLTVEAMTASIISGQDASPQGGIDYFWFDVIIGATFELAASLNLAILQASVNVMATVQLAVAAETRHSTHLLVRFGLKVDLSVSVLFFTIHIRFTLNVTIVDTTLGGAGLPPAQTQGPTPHQVKGLCGGGEQRDRPALGAARQERS